MNKGQIAYSYDIYTSSMLFDGDPNADLMSETTVSITSDSSTRHSNNPYSTWHSMFKRNGATYLINKAT